jgi:glycosyltransferase involved in cell wall biosynthesis
MPKALKVLYVAPEGSIDGSNASLRSLLVRLKLHGLVQSHVLVPSETIAHYYRQAGLDASVMQGIYTIPMLELAGLGRGFCGGLLRQAKGLVRWNRVANIFGAVLESYKPDLVHLNEITLIMHAAVARGFSIPVVMHDRAAVSKGTFGVRHAILCAALRRWVDVILAICPSYINRLGSAASIAQVVHNPFDVRQLLAIDDRPLPLDGHEKVRVLLVGAREEKGLFEALHAMQKADRCELQVVGTVAVPLVERRWGDAEKQCFGYHRRVARFLEAHSETAKRVQFLGALDDVTNVMASCHVVIVPWTVPHFARPLIEAWLMNKAVVASNVAGVADYCVDGVNSLVVPAGDTEALAAALVKVSSQPELARRLGAAGHETAKEFIGADDSHVKVFSAYEAILRGSVERVKGKA